MSTSAEAFVDIETVRTWRLRDNYGSVAALSTSIHEEGLRRPVTIWKDGTLISGTRRHRACLLLARKQIPAVFVDTIEDVAKRLLIDAEDDYLAQPWKLSETCHLIQLLRRLDEPAAIRRADAARRQGVENRRRTAAGKRKPGRASHPAGDYVLKVLSGPLGLSESTAKRLWAVYALAHGITAASDQKAEDARRALADMDAGNSSIYANYQRLMADRSGPVVLSRAAAPIAPAAAAQQLAAWSKALPQLEGLTAGLIELGPPNAELTWEQVGPVHDRLKAVRRDLEKMINKMRENNQP